MENTPIKIVQENNDQNLEFALINAKVKLLNMSMNGEMDLDKYKNLCNILDKYTDIDRINNFVNIFKDNNYIVIMEDVSFPRVQKDTNQNLEAARKEAQKEFDDMKDNCKILSPEWSIVCSSLNKCKNIDDIKTLLDFTMARINAKESLDDMKKNGQIKSTEWFNIRNEINRVTNLDAINHLISDVSKKNTCSTYIL